MNRKGQAAMEFLMTYGWAILVVLAAIAALAYFGVLSPNKLLPERTTFTAPLPSIDNAVVNADGTIVIAFRNNVGVAIDLTGEGNVTPGTGVVCTTTNTITAADNAGGAIVVDANSATATDIQNGETFLITWTCTPGTAPDQGQKFKADALYFTYRNTETGQTRRQVGTVDGKYQ
jgi:hypothetical protein